MESVADEAQKAEAVERAKRVLDVLGDFLTACVHGSCNGKTRDQARDVAAETFIEVDF